MGIFRIPGEDSAIFRSGDEGLTGGREVKVQTLNPYPVVWSRKALERDFRVFGDLDAFLSHYGEDDRESDRGLAVDFHRYFLVAVHQGLCPTGGYSVRARAVRARRSAVTIIVDFQEPGPGDIVTMAMTTPHLFLLVPRRRRNQDPTFRFRTPEGTLLAERKPTYGKSATGASGSLPS